MRQLRQLLSLILTFSLTIQSITYTAYAQESPIPEATQILLKHLDFLENNITPDGVVVDKLAGESRLRSTSLAGIMASWLYIGLRSSRALLILNKIAESVNTMIEKQQEIKLKKWSQEEKNKQQLLYSVALHFLALHYGITLNKRSRDNIFKLSDNLVENLGWRVYYSKASYIVLAAETRNMIDSKLPKFDLDQAVEDILKHRSEVLKILDTASPALLERLDATRLFARLISLSFEYNTQPNTELEKLWMESYYRTVEDYSRLPPLTPNIYWLEESFLTAFIDSYNVIKVGNFTTENESNRILSGILDIASNLIKIWKVDDEIVKQEFPGQLVYIYDPKLDLTRSDLPEKVLMYDLNLPILLIRLKEYAELNNQEIEILENVVSLAVREIIKQGDAYEVVEGFPSSDFVNRLLVSRFLAYWLSSMRRETNTATVFKVAEYTPYFVTSIFSLLVVLILALLYRLEKLFPTLGDENDSTIT